jgi:hypothetical protein
MREESLFLPVKIYLEGQGYSVHGEVKSWDIAAIKNEELIAIELKVNFCLSLVYQALKRKKTADSVYVCLPLQGSKASLPNHSKVRLLLTELNIGLILVRFLSNKTRVTVEIHPSTEHHGGKRRQTIIREISSRYSEITPGGVPSTVPILTAYRQEALKIAWVMKQINASISPRNLTRMGCKEKAGEILRKNFYGWFDKISRGEYELSIYGKKAIEQEYAQYISELSPIWEAKNDSEN